MTATPRCLRDFGPESEARARSEHFGLKSRNNGNGSLPGDSVQQVRGRPLGTGAGEEGELRLAPGVFPIGLWHEVGERQRLRRVRVAGLGVRGGPLFLFRFRGLAVFGGGLAEAAGGQLLARGEGRVGGEVQDVGLVGVDVGHLRLQDEGLGCHWRRTRVLAQRSSGVRKRGG